MKQIPQGLSCDISYKGFQLKYAVIEMIIMNHVPSNISMIVMLGFTNNQFYIFLKFCNYNNLFVFQMVNLIIFLKVKR
jgi:hypothetical protein